MQITVKRLEKARGQRIGSETQNSLAMARNIAGRKGQSLWIHSWQHENHPQLKLYGSFATQMCFLIDHARICVVACVRMRLCVCHIYIYTVYFEDISKSF